MKPSSIIAQLPISARCLILLWASVTIASCAPKPLPALAPSQVQNGQLFQSGQSEFDGLFRELHEQQLLLVGAPDEERQIRKTLAQVIAADAGATRQLLAERVATKATDLGTKKIRLKLEIEGLDADDPDDTMAQAKVVGSLDEDAQKFVEATALATRQGLRFSAQLRRAQKRIEHLAHHAAALDPFIGATFGGQGPAKVALVRHNLEDARRQLPLLAVRASELAEEARRTVQKLASAMTTDASIGSSKEPPLIAPVEPAPAPKRARTPTSNAPAKRAPAPAAAPAAKPSESGGADFEP